MAILQETDKCIRCNGCYVACKRTWKMKFADFKTRGKHRVDVHQRVVIKSMKKTDMGPFQRFSCWHCENPPCAGRCPYKAIIKQANGAVDIDHQLCKPDTTNPANGQTCKRQCVTDCQRGGYPKVGTGNLAGDFKSFKCTLCWGRAGYVNDQGVLSGTLPSKAEKDSTGYISTLWKQAPSAVQATMTKYVPELEHMPTCVMTCPAKAMHYDTRDNVLKYLANYHSGVGGNGGYYVGDGSMFWSTMKPALAAPKADPFVEDHVAPMVSGLLSSPIVAGAIVPTLVVGGLLAISARRQENEKDMQLVTEGEV